jgi:hypothetical protein
MKPRVVLRRWSSFREEGGSGNVGAHHPVLLLFFVLLPDARGGGELTAQEGDILPILVGGVRTA